MASQVFTENITDELYNYISQRTCIVGKPVHAGLALPTGDILILAARGTFPSAEGAQATRDAVAAQLVMPIRQPRSKLRLLGTTTAAIPDVARQHFQYVHQEK